MSDVSATPTGLFTSFLDRVLHTRLDERGRAFVDAALDELGGEVGSRRFGELLSLASRHARRTPLDLPDTELAEGRGLVEGLDPERWTLLDALRVRLVLGLAGLAAESGERALEDAFRFADEGETCALLRGLALVPGPERFVWRAKEGCRSNMRSVFEAAATDTPYPRDRFDDVAWRQALLKALFVGAPLWRIVGVDERLDAETQRMALDYADERRSANRPVPPELWMLLAGAPLADRALHAVEAEIAAGKGPARGGAYLALARGGRGGLLEAHLEGETDELARRVGRAALAGRHSREAFAPLRDREEIVQLGPNAARRWRASE